VPVVNIIQGVRHAAPDDERHPFLRHRAIRICLSEAVAEPIRASGRVNGPVVVIPNGMDTRGMPGALPQAEKDIDVLISALKQPALGAQLRQALAEPQRRVELLPSQLPRPEYLALLNRARIVLHLPSFVGGFCLPALEAMALDALLVCPDCIGNRTLCLPQHNCFRPEYDAASLLRDTEAALRLSPALADEMRRNAQATVAQYSLAAERARFVDLLDHVHELW
jgi:glycosyltransferase involved in cell wall biosynthesis